MRAVGTVNAIGTGDALNTLDTLDTCLPGWAYNGNGTGRPYATSFRSKEHVGGYVDVEVAVDAFGSWVNRAGKGSVARYHNLAVDTGNALWPLVACGTLATCGTGCTGRTLWACGSGQTDGTSGASKTNNSLRTCCTS